MTNTTFNDESTLCPSVPRRKGKADLLSTKTNMANTTFNDENTLCLPCHNAETMEIMRTRVAIEIAREIYYSAVFRRLRFASLAPCLIQTPPCWT
jgi:formate-dependent nitrite reductase cytochrome c552 subunit